MTEQATTEDPAEERAESSPARRMLSLAQAGNLREIEDGWVDFIDAPPEDPDFYAKIAAAFKKGKQPRVMQGLLALALDQLKEKGQWRAVFRIVSQLGANWPASDELRRLAVDAIRNLHADNPNLDEMIRRSRLGEEGPVDTGIKRFRAYLRMCEDQVYQHATWGEGVVREFRLREKKLVIDFPDHQGREITLDGVKNFLTWLPPKSFLALRARELEKLQTMAAEAPADLIRLAVEGAGGLIKQSDLKQLIAGSVIEDRKWNSWWTRARRELKLEPLLDFDAKGGAHAEIRLRDKPRTVEEEIVDIFFAPDAELGERIGAISHLEEARKSRKVDEGLPVRMLSRLSEDYRSAVDHSPAAALQMALMSEQLGAITGTGPAPGIPPSAELIKGIRKYEDLGEIDNSDYALRALQMLYKRDGQAGVRKSFALLPTAPLRLAQAIWRQIDWEHHLDEAVQAVETLLDRALENGETFAWAVKALLTAEWKHLEEFFPLSRMVPEVLSDLDEWRVLIDAPGADKDVVSSLRQLSTRIRSLLQANHYAIICAAAEQMNTDQAHRLRRTILSSDALNLQFKSAVDRQLILTRKDLEDQQAAAAAATTEPSFHYCTAKMRKIKLAEMNRLNSDEIPANSREIEEARQEGDLRENAGYHAAKDKQKMLMQQSLQLQQSISDARIFDASMVKPDEIGFGVKFEAENLTRERGETYIVLGRWEADPEKQIVSYLAPMMQQFMGKKVGDEFEVSHPGGGSSRYRIRTIENALASGEWNEQSDADR